jgi:hypothetical protein
MECWADFRDALSSDKRKYPIQQFKGFRAATKRYAELTRTDALIHRSLAGAVNGLVDFLEVERKRVPCPVLLDAERLTNPQDCEASPAGHYLKCGSPNFSQSGLSDGD